MTPSAFSSLWAPRAQPVRAGAGDATPTGGDSQWGRALGAEPEFPGEAPVLPLPRAGPRPRRDGGGKQVCTCPSLPSRGMHAPGGAPEPSAPRPCGSSGSARSPLCRRHAVVPGVTRSEPGPPAGPPYSGGCVGRKPSSASSTQGVRHRQWLLRTPRGCCQEKEKAADLSPPAPSGPQHSAQDCPEVQGPLSVQSVGPRGAQVTQLELPDNPKGLNNHQAGAKRPLQDSRFVSSSSPPQE